jgi:hypothetical protein
MTETAIETPVRRVPEWTGLAGSVLLGVVAGVAAKAADESGIGWAADLGSYPAAWVLAVALVGRYAPTLASAAVRAAVLFAAMTLAYYAWAAQVLGFGWSPQLAPWLVLSTTAVAGAAVGAWWGTRRSGPLPGALMAMAAGIAVAGGSLQQLWWTWTGDFPDMAARPVQVAVDVLVAVLLTLVLPRHHGTRIWALLLVVPLAGLASALLQRLYQLVG